MYIIIRAARLLRASWALVVVMLLWGAAAASARDCVLVDTWRYTVTLEGTNQLRLKMPLYDKDDYDCWIVEGTVSIQIEGGNPEVLFYYESERDISGGDYLPRIYCYRGVEGTMTLFRDRGYSSVSVGTSKGNDLCPCVDNLDYAIVNLLWDIPNKYRGKKVTISWVIHHTGNMTERNKYIKIESTTLTIPAAPELQKPMVMDAIVSYDTGRPNQMMVPYMMASNSIKSLTGIYTEVTSGGRKAKSVQLEPSTSGYVFLPAETCVKDFYVEAVYEDSEKKVQTTQSAKIDLPVLHQPKRLTAAMQPDGTVLVSWGMNDMNWSDLSSADSWEVQRNVTGDPTNRQWTSLGQMTFNEKSANYAYEDNLLLSAYQGKDVYYRVRRTITAIWDWNLQSGYAITKLPATLSLPTVNRATVRRDGTWNDASHGVKLDFGVGARSSTDERGRVILRDSTDWNTLAELVRQAKGTVDFNAVMASDFTVTRPLGSSEGAYRGSFDGNGHTLTVSLQGGEEELAPFHNVCSTVSISNLRVCGTVDGGIHSSGLVGGCANNARVTIERCHVSTRVSATGNDKNAPHAGGVIGYGHGSTHIIRYCMFDGTVTAVNTTGKDLNDSYVGAFVGWKDGSQDTEVKYNLESGGYSNFSHHALCYLSNRNWWPTSTNRTNYSLNGWNESAVTAVGMKADQLATQLGAEWEVLGGSVRPVLTSSDIADLQTLIWDNRAKLVLFIDKRVDESADENTVIIRNATDWQAFAAKVKASNGEYEVNAKLMADISVSEPIANYSGTFDGNGHTITLGLITQSGNYNALFVYGCNNVTVRNLNVKGEVRSREGSAGLVCVAKNEQTSLTFENCRVSTTLVTTREGVAGGLVAIAGSAKVTVRNCLFDGAMSFTSASSVSVAAAFVNLSSRSEGLSVENCLENGTYSGFELVTANSYINSGSYKEWRGASNLWTLAETGFEGINHAGSRTAAQLISVLGSQWQVNMSGRVVPVQENGARYVERRELTDDERTRGQLDIDLKTSCLDHFFRMVVERSQSPLPLSVEDEFLVTKTDEDSLTSYKFDNNVVLGKAKADTLQNAVSLTWECTRGQADFYRIKRYDKLTPDEVELLEDNYSQTAYIDRSVRPQHNYRYIIEGVTQCEGENISRVSVDGCCTPTGMVRGYVRLANGTGLPGYTVTATPVGTIDGAAILTCETDSTGYFDIGGLVYQKYGEYTLSVTDPTHEASFRPQNVIFDEEANLQTNIVFTQTNYYIFSGYVLYDGSSIPVSGVRFLRDGVEVVNSNGKPVTTNNQGAFEVSVPQGSHQIQVVKDGHIFLNDGFFITPDAQPDSTWHNWQKNISEVYLWDKTKVNLQGRVVGGDDQGLLPLGESLSKNNLGQEITIVLQLEGDNTSWIVRDQLNASVTERHDEYTHGISDTTRVDAYRHRIVIRPDVKTGEYSLPLYPVKYKVSEIYAKGYPTLFQTGMVSETIDLNNYAEGDTATYLRIYHSQPTLDVWQFTGTQDRFYGLKQYTSLDNAGLRDTVYLWKDGEYSLGYPVFMAGASVPMMLSAREEYHYNNEELGALDVVQLDGGVVYAGNGLIGTDKTDKIELDSFGQATYVFTPQNATFALENDMALRTLKFTLFYNDSYYDIAPIKGYVMAAIPQPQGRRIIAGKNTHLVDILRDPPGNGSSAYIERGSTFSYSYQADYTFQMGVNLDIGMGSGSDFYTGLWMGSGTGSTTGTINSSNNHVSLSYDLATSYYNDWTYEYEFETMERISTSDHEREIGADDDVYIGITDDIMVEDALAVRVVGSKGLERLTPALGGKTEVNGHTFDVKGTAQVLASGWDAVRQDSIYLVRDEVLQFSTRLSSSFVHSQRYLVNELIPSLIRTRNALLMDSTTTRSYAQTLADNMKQPVYVSKVAPDNENFSSAGYYTVYKPSEMQNQWTDSIAALNNQIYTWAGFIAANEKEKLEASDLVKVYDFDGASGVEYSETFTTTADMHRYWRLPSTVNITGEDIGGDNKGGEAAQKDPQTLEYQIGGLFFRINITPLLGFDFNYMNGVDTTYTKQTGFTLACSRKSNLSVAVYRTREISGDSIAKLATFGEMGVFYKNVEANLKGIYNGSKGSSNTTSYIENLNKVPRYRNLVFRTLGGATASPWEEERRTIFYNPGTILDQRTMQIDKLRIWAKEPSVSNVPYGEPARFTIYMTNESEFPERVTKELKYYLEDTMNPNGAKVFVDGAALTGTGIDLWLEPNTIIEKQIEVYAGAEYDYEDLGISFFNENDVEHIETVNISAHFVPAAGKVNISKPGNNWVVNTESAYDEEQQAYYLPVHIDGFDVNFRNFDHIELQYKLATQGDKDWVNVCSYYRNDEEGQRLMALASGKRQLMEHDGYIDAFFYGEKDPIEQHYDLRAVTYCRHANGYLTRSSNVLSGIKDTRRPQLFGTPQPVDGILDIGDDIILRFSEPIAANYLSAVNNFEVIGQTRSSNISLSTSLHFNGNDLAMSQSPRNLADKSFTVDVMLNPVNNGKDMTFFLHGEAEQKLALGLTADRRLTAAIKYDEDLPADVFVAAEPCRFDGLREVFCIFDADTERGTTTITFYDGNTKVGTFNYPRLYEGYGAIVIGMANATYLPQSSHFEGEMLEFRLWNRALTEAEMHSYGQKNLTGYELGLLDNYPLNEGEGDYSYNRTEGGSDLWLFGPTWKMPDGIAMKLDGDSPLRIHAAPFNRFDHEDYTLMFWFRTQTPDGTLLTNQASTATAQPSNKEITFALAQGCLSLTLSGLTIDSKAYAGDGRWHHAALTVNRARNVGSLYVDQQLTNTFAVDTLPGISGNYLLAGAVPLHIDELAMFEMALTQSGINTYAQYTPTGEEMGLLAYLSFSQNERQTDNTLRLMPSGVSLKRYKDTATGQLTTQRDTLVAQDDILAHCDRTTYAPMHDTQTRENIKFSYVADGKDLLINLDVPDAAIEKSNIFIVVNDVADMQGNLMASPAVLDLYVYRNPLRWNSKHLTLQAPYGQAFTFQAAISNLSGKTKRYTLSGLPLWMTASETAGTLRAMDEETITFTISPYTNIGNYEEVIYLVGDDGMSEPLPLSLKVRGDAPAWQLDQQLLSANISMSIIATVTIEGNIARDSEDILAVFNDQHRLLGVAHPQPATTAADSDGLIYINIYNTTYAPTPLRFEYFDASVGQIYKVTPDYAADDAPLTFLPDTILGTTTAPLRLIQDDDVVQPIPLRAGWNWLSFNVTPDRTTVGQILNNATTWHVGDALEADKDDGTHYLITYKAVADPRDPRSATYLWDYATDTIALSPATMYRCYSADDKVAYITGTETFDDITVRKGWNRIGYISSINLPLGTALAEYTEQAAAGDIIKSQSQFAILTTDAHGNKQWKGTLTHMRVGEGYMLRRTDPSPATFAYPIYYGASRYSGAMAAPATRDDSAARHLRPATTMTLVAKAQGIPVQPGDQLLAYRGPHLCGTAEADTLGTFYLSIADIDGAPQAITFVLQHADQQPPHRADAHHIRYVPDAAIGTPDQPADITFSPQDCTTNDDRPWYDIAGRKLNDSHKPQQKGIYIHNGKKSVRK